MGANKKEKFPTAMRDVYNSSSRVCGGEFTCEIEIFSFSTTILYWIAFETIDTTLLNIET